MKRNASFPFFLFLAVCLLFVCHGNNLVRADTGTYTVTHQYVDLTIQTDGDVVIHYDIAMTVQSGNIPWVTVGLPNSDYQIRTYSGDAASVSKDNSGSWSGVSVTLLSTYYAGDTFHFSFEVLQKGFVYKYNAQQASISFTPCWWDNAMIDDLKVTVFPPSGVSNITANTPPTRYEGSSVIWEWNNVQRGEHKTIGVLMPLSAFTSVGSQPGFSFQFPDWLCGSSYLIFPGIIILFFILSAVFRRRNQLPYEEPQVYSGGIKSLFRHINLDCPNDGTRLQRRTFQGTTIDFCESCGGAYFDKGEIEALIDANVNEQQFNSTQVSSFQHYSTTVNNECPRCRGTFQKISKTSDEKTYDIFVCKDCGGIWLNKGMYQLIKEKRIDQDTLQQKTLSLTEAQDGDQKKALNAPSWWLFYPYIFYPRRYYQFFPPPVVPVQHTCACVSCACAGGCACACACAGGGAAGCAPKDTMWPQISFLKKK